MYRLILVLFAALALQGRAHACTLFDFNIYDGYYQPSIIRLAREAATIDWVEVNVTGPQRCPRFPDPMFERDKYLASIEVSSAEREAYMTGPCSYPDSPEPGLFAATVVERLKGQSAATFELYHGPADGSDVRWGFSDVRELVTSDAYRFNRNQRIEADERHASLAYWYRAVADMPLDGTTSCGGRPAFTPYIRYIVFRDARGAVMSYAPVMHQDDVLLMRLRKLRDDPAADIRTAMSVEDYFRQTSDLVLGSVVRCAADDDGWDRGTEKLLRSGVITVERGDADFLDDANSDTYAPLEKNQASFDYLSHHFKYRGEACPVVGRVLIADLDTSEAGGAPSSWSFADHIMKVAATILDPEYGARSFEYWGVWSMAQPIRVGADGRVKLSDVQSGLRIDGPDSVSVEDIFRWHEEGRAKR